MIYHVYIIEIIIFEKSIHEQLVSIKNDSKRLDGFLMPMEVIHHGYAIKDDDMVKSRNEI